MNMPPATYGDLAPDDEVPLLAVAAAQAPPADFWPVLRGTLDATEAWIEANWGCRARHRQAGLHGRRLVPASG